MILNVSYDDQLLLQQKEEIEKFIRLSGFSSTSVTAHDAAGPNLMKADYTVDNETVLVHDNVTTYSIAVTELR